MKVSGLLLLGTEHSCKTNLPFFLQVYIAHSKRGCVNANQITGINNKI